MNPLEDKSLAVIKYIDNILQASDDGSKLINVSPSELADNLGYIISINDKVNYTTDIDYISEYKDLIVSNNNKNIDYEITHDDSVLYGKVYIDDSKNINIVDGFSKKEKKA